MEMSKVNCGKLHDRSKSRLGRSSSLWIPWTPCPLSGKEVLLGLALVLVWFAGGEAPGIPREAAGMNSENETGQEEGEERAAEEECGTDDELVEPVKCHVLVRGGKRLPDPGRDVKRPSAEPVLAPQAGDGLPSERLGHVKIEENEENSKGSKRFAFKDCAMLILSFDKQ